MIAVLRRRDTSKQEKDRISKQSEIVRAHNFGKLGKSFYTEDTTGEKTGRKGELYISPVKLRKKI